MDADARGRAVALVAAEIEQRPSLDVIGVLDRCGWGVMLLPPAWYPEQTARVLLDQVAEHVHEFARQRYRLALVGDRAGLQEALDRAGVQRPAAVDSITGEELESFLASL
jgi:hypothetical protein